MKKKRKKKDQLLKINKNEQKSSFPFLFPLVFIHSCKIHLSRGQIKQKMITIISPIVNIYFISDAIEIFV